ncbi:hypothetical protein THRCLA_01374 [Thraustotheca clavata]|uniref:Uncharacterized protein n=1 Tax=Thraustotheca clavata TaxID=74557 RepID=A0A1W0A8G5_9STRA|nr:hypothetical protein THRCLA_01374 [Thraustotheca clavata]
MSSSAVASTRDASLTANLMLLSTSLMGWAGEKVDKSVVTPCANMISGSIANPYVLSSKIWDTLKEATPQRARDVSRLISLAISNSALILSSDNTIEWSQSTKALRDHTLAMAATPQGQILVQDCIATVAKTSQALNTPETKAATKQFTKAIQSWIQMLATPQGMQVIDDFGNWASYLTDIAASPESTIFLLEVATNLCHVLTSDNAVDIPRDQVTKHLEETMLEKFGMDASMFEQNEKEIIPEAPEEDEEVEELGTDEDTDFNDTDSVISVAFSGVDKDTKAKEKEVKEEIIPKWDSEPTHATIRQRHAKRKMNQAIRTVPRRNTRASALLSTLRKLRRKPEPKPVTSALDDFACRVLSIIVVVFAGFAALIILLAMVRLLL